MGSPPENGSKKQVLKCLSANNIVNPPAKTGTAKISKKEVINMDQAKSEASISLKDLICINVTIKFIAPNKEDNPAKCNEPIKKSTAMPGL